MFKKADHIIYFVEDMARAKAFYAETLGLPIIMDYPGFVGVDLGGIWLGLHPSEMQGEDIGRGAFVYLQVDIRLALEQLQTRGVRIHQQVHDVPSGKVATILDSEGNALGLYQSFD